MITDVNSEDRLVQETFTNYLNKKLGWESIYSFNDETFAPNGTLGRANERVVVFVRDLRACWLKFPSALFRRTFVTRAMSR